MKNIRLLIVDDHTLVRDGLVSILNLENDIQIVGIASCGREALDIIKKVEVDVVLMDIIMPEMNGLETTALIKQYNSSIEVVLLSFEINEEFVAEGIKQKAKGYLPKDVTRAELVDAIKTVHAGEKYFAKEISDLIFNGF